MHEPPTPDQSPNQAPDQTPPPRRSIDVSEWPVMRKVALVLAVPFLLAVLLGAMRVQTELSEAATATATASQVTVLGPSVNYLSAAEDAAIVFRATEDGAERTAALKAVNAAAADLESSWSEADLSDTQREQVRSLLDTTQPLRDGSAFTTVSSSVDQLSQLEAEVTLGIAAMTDGGAQTELLINVVGQLNKGRLAVTESQLLVVQRPSIIPKNDLYGLFGAEDAVIDNLELLLPDNATVELLRQFNSSNTGLLGIGTPKLKGQQPLAMYDGLSTTLLEQIEGTLSDEAAASNRTALITALLTGLALLVAIGLAVVVSRALVLPIRLVRDGALAVARESLPETVRRIRAGEEPGRIEPIPVSTHEELGQLARAVDDLHGTAVELARNESELRSRVADMFVTLSRRNTSLVNQQLHLIERLETDEEDPQRLENLFQLDHLASRMRRTAESLVILADAPTQHSEQDVLSVDEALQAATAGVQDYPRVELSGAPSQRITGAAAPDVVHLFTELIDNALSFSPPSTPVRVTTSTPAGMVLVEVADAGLGIDTQTLAELNTTLRTGAEITADAARRMGLFVVARLARRHGLTVTLERNPEGGTTARVFLPKPLLLPAATPESALESTPESTPSPASEPHPTPIAPLEVASAEPPTDEEPAQAVEDEVAAAWVSMDEEPVEPTVEPRPAVLAHDLSPVNLDSLAAVINANIRLPQREPGTAPQPAPLTSRLPQRQVQPQAPIAPEAEPRVAPIAQPEPPSSPAPPTRAVTATATATAPAPPVVDPLAGDAPYYDTDEDADSDTPMFKMLRSNWFSGVEGGWEPSAADAGWRAADRADDSTPSQLTRSGLPVRDPGNRLVPGGVTQTATTLQRDPEAIRARLAAHAAGVARGRSAAAAEPEPTTTPTEHAEDVTG